MTKEQRQQDKQQHMALVAGRAPRRPPSQVIKQYGLAHPRLSAHHEHPAPARPHRIDELIKHAAFAEPVR